VTTILSCCTTSRSRVDALFLESIHCIVALLPPSRPVFGQSFPLRMIEVARLEVYPQLVLVSLALASSMSLCT